MFLTTDVLKTVYYALIHSHLSLFISETLSSNHPSSNGFEIHAVKYETRISNKLVIPRSRTYTTSANKLDPKM